MYRQLFATDAAAMVPLPPPTTCRTPTPGQFSSSLLSLLDTAKEKGRKAGELIDEELVNYSLCIYYSI